MFVRIDRRRKLPATTLLFALDGAETAALREERGPQGLQPYEAQGMSKEEILNTFYDSIVYERAANGWKTPFNPDRMKGVKLVGDLIDAKTGSVMAEAGTKITPRLARKLIEQGLEEQLVATEELAGRYLAADLINEQTGEVYHEAGDELSLVDIEKLEKGGVTSIPVLAIDHINVGSYIRNTMAADRNASREDALIDIYRVMRPGEPPTLDLRKRCSTACSSIRSVTICPLSAASR